MQNLPCCEHTADRLCLVRGYLTDTGRTQTAEITSAEGLDLAVSLLTEADRFNVTTAGGRQ
jgi:hypothetical protein